MISKIVDCGFKVTCEDTEEFPDQDDCPHHWGLCMLYNFASEVPNELAYPIFKERIHQCMQQTDPLARKAGIKILGHVSDSEALLDDIKEDIDEWIEIIIKTM